MEKRKTKASFLRFIEEFSTEAPPAAHHLYLIEKLQAVADGKIKRLMVLSPPGSAKSHYANVMFSAWWAGRNPGKKLITASYGQEVADKWGRRVRSIVRDEKYQSVFNASLSTESQAVGRWELDTHAEYYAVGVGGSVTSYRADLAIIDDPVKGREEADSELQRNKTIDWWQSDLWTRLKPGAAAVMIMTPWHEGDIGAWLRDQATKGGEQWEVVSFPMEAEANDILGRQPGELLWPEWFTPEMVSIAKRNARNWSALYQLRPAPEDGDFFKREWFRYYDEVPAHTRPYGASDYAVTADGGDYTVHIIGKVDPLDNLYITDVWREQTDSLEWVESLIALIKENKPTEWAEENGQISKGIGPLIDKRQREEKAYCYRKQLPSSADKPTRAQSIRGRMAQGKVYFPAQAPWLAEFERELLSFPAGKHDDQVDAFGLLGRLLSEMIPGKIPPTPQKVRWNHEQTFNEIRDQNARQRRQEND